MKPEGDMDSKRVLASLAGASLLLPVGAATGAPTGVSPDPFHRLEQKPTKVGYSSFTLSAGQQMAGRQDVSIDGDYYHVILYVSTSTGGIAYVPDVTFMTASNIAQSEFTSAMYGVFATNSTDFTNTSMMGSGYSGSCLMKQDVSSINWVPTTSSVLVAVRLHRTTFDSLVARNTSSLTIHVGVNSVSSCPGASSGSSDNK
jgi:hypothetical protein